MPDEAWRLFLALWPTHAVRDVLVRLQAGWDWPPSAALVQAARLHVTLHFIGSVPATRVPALQAGLRVPFEPFVLGTGGARAQLWRGGLGVLELQAPPALQRLHAALAGALREMDLPVEERPYRPHVTFARKAAGARPPRDCAPLAWPVDDGYALVRTVPGRGYAIVHRHPGVAG